MVFEELSRFIDDATQEDIEKLQTLLNYRRVTLMKSMNDSVLETYPDANPWARLHKVDVTKLRNRKILLEFDVLSFVTHAPTCVRFMFLDENDQGIIGDHTMSHEDQTVFESMIQSVWAWLHHLAKEYHKYKVTVDHEIDELSK